MEFDPDVGPTIRLALGGPKNVLARAFSEPRENEDLPAILCSYWYLDKLFDNRNLFHYRDWVLDSGAFSAKNCGAEIDLVEYTEACHRLLKSEDRLSEVFGLDVIGSPKDSIKNCEYMWEHGVPAIPTFHYKSDYKYLVDMVKAYPKIALGGAVGLRPKTKIAWARYCFSLIWKAVGPSSVHGFGFGTNDQAMACPFHSMDASTWEYGPLRFGNWPTYGRIPTRGGDQNLRKEVLSILRIQRKARVRWEKEMKKIANNTHDRFGDVNLGDVL